MMTCAVSSRSDRCRRPFAFVGHIRMATVRSDSGGLASRTWPVDWFDVWPFALAGDPRVFHVVLSFAASAARAFLPPLIAVTCDAPVVRSCGGVWVSSYTCIP